MKGFFFDENLPSRIQFTPGLRLVPRSALPTSATDTQVWEFARIVQMRIEGEQRSLIHINTLLVRADSPEEAHQKACELGRQEERSYENTDGRVVSVIFRGLGELVVIHDELEHGAELAYQEKVGLTEEQIRALVIPKPQLGVFAPRKPSAGPNYMPKSVMDELRKEGFDESDVWNSNA